MWNVKACNLYYEKFLEDRKDYKYRLSMSCVKPCVNTTLSPFVLKNPTPSRKTRNLIEQNKEIKNQNKRLLFSMMYIDTNPSNYHPIRLNPTRTFASLNNAKKKREFKRIDEDNQRLLHSLQTAKSDYAYSKLKADSAKYLKYKKNLAKPLHLLRGIRPISQGI